MEYLIVEFAGDRDVIVDGNVVGKTNSPIALPPGTYVVELGGGGYFPLKQQITLANTSRAHPARLQFGTHGAGDGRDE